MQWLGSIVGALTASEWQAVGSIGTLAVAIVAATVAFFQVREARMTREDQARPYVAVFLEMDGILINLVVKNFGNSVARNVTMISDAPMVRSTPLGGKPDTIDVFKSLPVLVPSQEWRTWFDSGTTLTDEQPIYTVTVRYEDARNRRLPADTFRLDWHQFESVLFSSEKDLDDVGRALDKIASTLDNWTEGLKGLKVYTRSGSEKDEQERQWVADAPRRRKALEDAQAAALTDSGPGLDDVVEGAD